MRPRNILITWGNGQLAWELVNGMSAVELTLTDLSIDQLDITKPDEIERAIQTYEPHLIINTAAYTAVDKAEQEKELAFKVNRDGAGFIAKQCAQHRIPLVHVSTDYVFDGKKNSPYLEMDPAHPLSVYGQSKWEGEEAVRNNLYNHVILRVSGSFSSHGHNFVKTIIKLASERESIDVVNDQITCPTPATGIADAIFQIANTILAPYLLMEFWGTFHYCSAPPTTWYDFAAAIIEEAKLYKPLKVKTLNPVTSEQLNLLAKRPRYSVLDCDKIGYIFGVRPAKRPRGLHFAVQEILT